MRLLFRELHFWKQYKKIHKYWQPKSENLRDIYASRRPNLESIEDNVKQAIRETLCEK